MAECIRRAKAGSSWREHELMAYNISTVEQDQQTFFDGPLPNYTGPLGFAQYEDVTDDLDEASVRLINLLKAAARPMEGEESAVDDFAALLLRAMGYERRDTFVPTRKTLRLDMSGEEVCTQADICLMDVKSSNILLVVQEDKSHINLKKDPLLRIRKIKWRVAAKQEVTSSTFD
jgi:hypothetical protein